MRGLDCHDRAKGRSSALPFSQAFIFARPAGERGRWGRPCGEGGPTSRGGSSREVDATPNSPRPPPVAEESARCVREREQVEANISIAILCVVLIFVDILLDTKGIEDRKNQSTSSEQARKFVLADLKCPFPTPGFVLKIRRHP